MKRARLVFTVVLLCVTTLPTVASAASPYRGCSVGSGNSGGSTIGPWQLLDEAEFATALASSGGDPAEAAVIFAKEDNNQDGLLCVVEQILPNDASGSDTWYVSHDNNARP